MTICGNRNAIGRQPWTQFIDPLVVMSNPIFDQFYDNYVDSAILTSGKKNVYFCTGFAERPDFPLLTGGSSKCSLAFHCIDALCDSDLSFFRSTQADGSFNKWYLNITAMVACSVQRKVLYIACRVKKPSDILKPRHRMRSNTQRNIKQLTTVIHNLRLCGDVSKTKTWFELDLRTPSHVTTRTLFRVSIVP